MSTPTHSTARQKTHSVSWPDAYGSLANALLVTATFAGTITFSLVLAPRDDGSEGNAARAIRLLAYASSLFLGSAIGCISVFVVCRAGQGGGAHEAVLRVVAQVSFVLVGALMIVAFGLLLGSLSVLGLRGPFVLGVVLFVGFTGVPVVVGCFMLSPYFHPGSRANSWGRSPATAS